MERFLLGYVGTIVVGAERRVIKRCDYDGASRLVSPNSLSSPQIPPFSEILVTVPTRLDTARFSTVPRNVRFNTLL